MQELILAQSNQDRKVKCAKPNTASAYVSRRLSGSQSELKSRIESKLTNSAAAAGGQCSPNMFENSPRAGKRRKVNDGKADNSTVLSLKWQQEKESIPRVNTGGPEAFKGGREKENNLSDDPVPSSLQEHTFEPMDLSQNLIESDDQLLEDPRAQLQTTPSKARIRRPTKPQEQERTVNQAPNATTLPRDGHNDSPHREGSMHDTINVAQPPARTSARQRKTTWKLVDDELASETPKRPKKTPTPLKRSQKKVAMTLTPVAKSRVPEEPATTPAALAAAALNVVRDTNVTPTPTPKKRGRPRKDPNAPKTAKTPMSTPKKQKPPPTTLEASLPIQSPQAPVSHPDIAELPESAHDDVMIDASPFKTQPLNLTPTPRKRGRPPKAKVVDEFGFLAVDPLGTPSKRQKTSLAQDAEDVDPLAKFVRRDAAAIAAKSLQRSTPAKTKTLRWQDFGDVDVDSQPKPDPISSFAMLKTLLEDETYHEPLKDLKVGIVQALTGKRRMPLHGLDEEYQKVKQIVENTVVSGEGNSMMVIGPRGCGKSTLLEGIVSEMVLEHPDEFHVIRLNGLIHTDDKLALREIWRQLGREMALEDETLLERNNYADTLTSLLAVLSHDPADKRRDEGQEVPEREAQISRSVVFIIDEFDLFTSHARQTLLYNLFDIAQARKAPIAVLGLTTRVDVTESLEKRVKSRFSHRSVFLPRPKSFPGFQRICLEALKSGSVSTIPSTGSSPDEEAYAEASRTLHAVWSDYITSLFHESTAVTAVLRNIYATSRSVPTALTSFLLPIAAFSPSNIPSDSNFVCQALLAPDSKLNLLPSLTDLELALLIAAARLDIILNVDTCNFNMAYDEYTQLTNRTRLQASASGAIAVGSGTSRLWSREAALGAWERLEILELIMPLATAGYGAGAGLADVGRAGKLMRCDVSMEEIRYCGVGLSAAMLKWCKEI